MVSNIVYLCKFWFAVDKNRDLIYAPPPLVLAITVRTLRELSLAFHFEDLIIIIPFYANDFRKRIIR
jgi:hypothetical protein